MLSVEVVKKRGCQKFEICYNGSDYDSFQYYNNKRLYLSSYRPDAEPCERFKYLGEFKDAISVKEYIKKYLCNRYEEDFYFYE